MRRALIALTYGFGISTGIVCAVTLLAVLVALHTEHTPLALCVDFVIVSLYLSFVAYTSIN